MKHIRFEFGDTFREKRVQKKLSQQEVADRVGISQNAYFRIESNKAVRVDTELVEKITDVLDMDVRKITLDHLPEHLKEFIAAPEAVEFLEEAYLKWRAHLLSKRTGESYAVTRVSD